MATEPLSEHCSLMSKPDGPPKPAELPADCPKDAAYVKWDGDIALSGNKDFPVVIEGGDGNDKITVVGSGKAGVRVDGGGGNDTLTAESEWVWLAQQVGPTGLIFVAALGITLATIAMIAWRALTPKDQRRSP
jgi:hypothetical protein